MYTCPERAPCSEIAHPNDGLSAWFSAHSRNPAKSASQTPKRSLGRQEETPNSRVGEPALLSQVSLGFKIKATAVLRGSAGLCAEHRIPRGLAGPLDQGPSARFFLHVLACVMSYMNISVGVFIKVFDIYFIYRRTYDIYIYTYTYQSPQSHQTLRSRQARYPNPTARRTRPTQTSQTEVTKHL